MTTKTAELASRFYKVLAQEGDTEATILLYGYIGEYYEYDEEKERWRPGGITDLKFVQELNRLAEKYQVIHLRINSYGGDFLHGNGIMTSISNCAAEVHTWIDGIAASMAADIWLCGHRRHMAKNALLMIHPVWSWCAGNAQDMRDCADMMDKMTNAAIIATAASTGISEDEIRARYYADYKDHWLTYNDASADGLVTETGDEYEAADLPADIDGMTYKQLVQHFEKNTAGPESKPLLERLRENFEKSLAALVRKSGLKPTTTPSTHANNADMTFDEFKTSLADKSLALEAVKAHLATLEPTPEATETPEEETADTASTGVDEIAALKEQIEALQKQVEEFGAKPGAAKSTPGAPAGDALIGDTHPSDLEKFNKEMADIAASGATPYRPQI